MSRLAEQRLNRLLNSAQQTLLKGSRIGLEKETLRVSPDGHIAQTPHPQALGSALTHPYITTDYSESLLEFITPPYPGLDEALDFLEDIHRFVYHNVDEEMLWATSMPCVVDGENNIPIAWYGRSNPGFMKHVYRRGLGHRYGKIMQVIAGVHFNYSLAEDFWPVFQDQEQDSGSLQHFRSHSYFCLIRNLQRFGWLIPYLFGASPAVCKSILAGQPSTLPEYDSNTYYQPYATSLRMSDMGYTNKNRTGLKVIYDSLEDYIASLSYAIQTPYPDYQRIGVVVDGEYRQLNANILQIENEYYSTMRPKQVPLNHEKPTLALQRRGVQYVELRSIDVSACDPVGINTDQLRFLEAFLIYCLFHDSPPIDDAEHQEIEHNQLTAAIGGRNPKAMLQRQGQPIPLRQWAMDILKAMQGICETLDSGEPERAYSQSLALQKAAVEEPELTPSARILAAMNEAEEGFFHFAKRMSLDHQAYFKTRPLDSERLSTFTRAAEQSLQRQQALEADDEVSFADYLERYLAS